MRLSISSKLLVIALLGAFAGASGLHAQDARGRITGRVLDPTSAVVPEAKVTATQLAMNTHVTTRTNQKGNYDLPYLLPGAYRIDVEAAGFKRYASQGIVVEVGDTLTIDVKLQIGDASEHVTVTAETPLVEAGTGSMSQVMSHKQLENLPLEGGNVAYMIQLSAGVTTGQTPGHPYMPGSVDTASNMTVAGTGNQQNEFMLDGVSNMSRSWVSFTPPADMVQEFRLQTSTYDASVGHAAGGSINMSLKTGTNQLHGTANWEAAPNPWQANDFFTNKQIYDLTTGPVTPAKIAALAPPIKVNRYSATLGGPVLLPHIYNGKNRTFWEYGFQGFNQRNPNNNYYTVPTLPERQGDFSALLGVPKTGATYQIYDPATITPVAGGHFSRQPIPGNIIPASRITPVALNYLKFYPQPNAPGTVDGGNNYQRTVPQSNDFVQNMARIDHNISERNRLFGRFTQSWLHYIHGDIFDNPARGLTRYRKQWGAALDDVYTVSPSLILNLKYGFTRFLQSDFPTSAGYDIASLGIPSSLAAQIDPQARSFPQLNFDHYANLGETGGSQFITNYHTLAGTFTKIAGDHSIRWGGEFRVLEENTLNYGDAVPQFNFSNTWTKGPLDSSTGAPRGQDLATFLLGLPTGGDIQLNSSYAEKSTFTGLFVQDDWKVTRKLTLNIGLRWEYESAPVERYNRTARGFDPSVPSPISAAALAAYTAAPDVIPVSQFATMGVLTFAGVNGQPNGYFNTDKHNFAPRFGFAYQLTPKTVLRGGYGIFYETIGINQNHAKQEGFSQQTNLIPSIDNGLHFTSTLANPFPNGVLQPGPVGPDTYIGRAISFYPANYETPYMQRWSFSIQRQLPLHSVLELSYVGNRGTNLETTRQMDVTPAQYLSTSPFRDQATIDWLSAKVTNPFYGIPEFAGGGITGTKISRANLLQPYPQYNGISYSAQNGESWYHSFNLRFEKRFSRGVLLNVNYNRSKWMQATAYLNDTDPQPSRVIWSNDHPNRLTANGVWALPVGKGRMLMGNAPRLLDAIAGGWQYQALWIWQTGAPIGFGNILFMGDIHDITLPPSQRSLSEWFNVDAGFNRVTTNNLSDNIRTFPLRFANIREPNVNYWNMALFKQFQLHERLRMEVRTEWQGALNNPQFSPPNAAPTNTLFGQIDNTDSGARRVYAGLKVLF